MKSRSDAGDEMGKRPRIEVYSHVEGFSAEMCQWLQERAEFVFEDCLASPGEARCDLPGLTEIEISVVSDQTIAGVHDEFFDDPSPTDVITFPHGELLISWDTARDEACSRGHSVLDELLLYLIHGLLHLNGHVDDRPESRAAMETVQESIWRKHRQ